MDLGCCAPMDRVPAIEAAKGDYYELSVAGTVMAGGEEGEGDFARLLERAAAFSIKPRAYNVFLPGSLPVVGPAVEREAVERYVRAAFGRVRRLEGRVVVFGSGRSRSIPEGFGRDAALDQLADFLRLAGGLSGEYGITLVIEPLRRAESNVFNSVGESAAFIRERRLDRDGVRLLADLYHMMEEDEPLTAVVEGADLLAHTHVADSGRQAPGSGGYPITEFFGLLRQSGYAGDCSIECRWDDFDAQIGPSLDFLRGCARAAGW